MKKLIFAISLALAGPALCDEQITLDAPYTVDPRSTTVLRVRGMHWEWGETPARAFIRIAVNNGDITRIFSYEGQEARDLLVIYNKMNFSTVSQQRRILNRLIADGKLSGTVSGTPD